MRKVKNLCFVICLTLLFSNYTTTNNTYNKNIFSNSNPLIKKEKVFFSSKLIGENTEVGTLTISYKNKTNLYVTFTIKKGWNLNKTKLFVGDYNDIPLKNNGCPNLKEVENQKKHEAGVQKHSYSISVHKFKKTDCTTIISKAVVTQGNKTINAWSQGESFSCDSTITYSQFCPSKIKKKNFKSSKKEILTN
ncbi:hypothetical protein ACSIGC_05280 [Tenacibaculum sp. ZS6-P6]|uniref:hypothetical protein n=1 Tax=Tenacibaculum sp. ZS6-P6 TaxID=3447503 RepID=UPI003F991023